VERGLELVQAVLRSVDADRHRVLCADGDVVPYDMLLLALGARADEAVPGALTFRGPQDSAHLRRALEELDTGAPMRIAFAASPHTACPYLTAHPELRLEPVHPTP
jgi:NADPH-dependent 2,4-dienoyl-CoA reductase/sulfur reductase-like enzyme